MEGVSAAHLSRRVLCDALYRLCPWTRKPTGMNADVEADRVVVTVAPRIANVSGMAARVTQQGDG